MNHFATLGLPYGATQDEVKKAFYKLAHVHHPDKGGDTEMFKKISNAYHECKKIAPTTRVTSPSPASSGATTRSKPFAYENVTITNNVFYTSNGFKISYSNFGQEFNTNFDMLAMKKMAQDLYDEYGV